MVAKNMYDMHSSVDLISTITTTLCIQVNSSSKQGNKFTTLQFLDREVPGIGPVGFSRYVPVAAGVDVSCMVHSSILC